MWPFSRKAVSPVPDSQMVKLEAQPFEVKVTPPSSRSEFGSMEDAERTIAQIDAHFARRVRHGKTEIDENSSNLMAQRKRLAAFVVALKAAE